jgi:nucleoside-diphosphate-sugar epimerase
VVSVGSARGRFGRVLVTGATGFVGGAVVRALLASGRDVLALVRDPARARVLEQAGAILAAGDMLAPDTYRGLADQVDAVIHAAQRAPPGRMTRVKVADIQRADHTMSSVLAQACRAGGRRYVYTSGYFVYGDRGDAPLDTRTTFDPSPLGTGHAREVTELRQAAAGGLDLVIVAPGFVYGPGGLFKSAFFDQAQRGRLRCIGAGRNYWSCVHVEDLAEGYVAALEHAPPGGEYNLADDEPLRLRDLVDQVTGAMGLKPVGTIPPWLMSLIIGRPLVQSLVTSCRVTNTEAAGQLGWRPARPTLADGLPDAIARLRKAAERPAGARESR